MAKGDQQAVRNQIDYSGNQAQNELLNTRYRQQQVFGPAYNYFQQGTNTNLANYADIMNRYQQFMNPTPPSSTGAPLMNRAGQPPGQPQGGSQQWMTGDPTRDPLRQQAYNYITQAGGTPTGRGTGPTDLEYYVDQMMDPVNAGYGDWAGRVQRGIQGTQGGGGIIGTRSNTGDPFYDSIMNAIGGYGNFAETGGFSPQDVQNIQARMTAPIRAVYSQAQANLDRQRELAGGAGSPGYAAAQAKLARDEAYGLSDQTTNAQAAIAQMLQQGRLMGLQGLAGTGGAARGQNLGALSGQTGLYGASPGLARTFGDEVLQSVSQDLQGQGLQNQLANMLIQGRLGQAQVPGNFTQAMGNIGDVLGLFGTLAGGIGGIPGIGSLFSRGSPGGIYQIPSSTINPAMFPNWNYGTGTY